MAPALTADQASLILDARRATLATIAPDGQPRLVPCCVALVSGGGTWALVTPIDAKPKASSDPMRLARVRDIRRDPRVTLLVDRWDEDWARLAWLRIVGDARLLLPWAPPDAVAHASAVSALRNRYPQYRDHRLEAQPIIRIAPTRITGWSAEH
jgi:PPOX class probable F420-dependent enzyme